MLPIPMARCICKMIRDFVSSRFGENVMFTPEGGLAVRYTAGENLVEGQVVRMSPTVDNEVIRTGLTDGANGRNMPVGAVYAAVSSGEYVWVVVSGKAYYLFDGNTTHGDFCYVSGANLGQAIAANVPSVADHWREIGHCAESRVGSGLALTTLHFN